MKKISIRMKIIVIMIVIGIIMILFCWSNVSALKKIEGYIQEIRKLAMPCGLSLEDIIEMFRILEEDE